MGYFTYYGENCELKGKKYGATFQLCEIDFKTKLNFHEWLVWFFVVFVAVDAVVTVVKVVDVVGKFEIFFVAESCRLQLLNTSGDFAKNWVNAWVQ